MVGKGRREGRMGGRGREGEDGWERGGREREGRMGGERRERGREGEDGWERRGRRRDVPTLLYFVSLLGSNNTRCRRGC